ncbi:hypothetical protein LTR09_012150 [Extremus antarcticus]|uniref:Uncharacterized protein n=1 Tax=Extremus antarcticus TaxID=702011 RepID=A0AAJ0G405_9PEZI|nr:hypothetical protein LTR09_012150 [Extremus antarcticus]
MSPRSPAEDWRERYGRGATPPPLAPDPPPPTSPTFTSSSSQTLNSSHTSYSDAAFIPVQTVLTHWAQSVFDGQNPSSSFNVRNPEDSMCDGTIESLAVQNVLRDGFVQALEVCVLSRLLIASSLMVQLLAPSITVTWSYAYTGDLQIAELEP